MRTLVSVLGAGALILAIAAVSHAGPIPPTPLGVGSVGQSLINSSNAPGSFLNVDWMVIDATPFGFAGEFAYLYQVENDSAIPMLGFTINFDLGPGNLSTAGFSPSADLDVDGFFPGVLGHNTTNFPVALAGETEPAVFQDLDVGAVIPNVTISGGTLTSITYTWGGGTNPLLASGSESGVFFLVSKLPPVYGHGQLFDTVVPSPWITTVAGSDRIPTNLSVSEPGSLLLLGLGLSGLALWRRRRAV